MMGIKLLYVLWLIAFGLPALSYAQYLHDDEENIPGAFVVFFMVLIACIGVYQIEG